MARQGPQAPIDLAGQAWAGRLKQLTSAGVTPQQIRKAAPIIRADVRSVRTGGQGMSNDEALLSVVSAIKGHPVLQKKENSGWSPIDLVGDAVHDIKDLTTQAIPGLARFVVNLPDEIGETAHYLAGASRKWEKKHGYDPNVGGGLSGIAGELRNLAHTPIVGFIPGVHTAAGLTTDAGRMSLLHHPIQTTLDVLPWAAGASKALGLAAKAGAVEGSAAEAALQARPIKALYRGLVPEATRADIAAGTTGILRKMKMDPQSFLFSRHKAWADRTARKEFNAMMDAYGVNDILKDYTPDDLQLLAHEAQFPDEHPNITPEHTHVLERVDAINHALVSKNPQLHYIPIDGVKYVYHESSPVVKTYYKMLDAEAQATEMSDLVNEGNLDTKTAERRMNRASEKATDAQEAFDTAAKANPPASYIPMVERKMREYARTHALANKDATTHVDTVLADLDQDWMHQHVDPVAWEQIRADARAGWQDIVREAKARGEKPPTWIHQVDTTVQDAGINVLPDPVTMRKMTQVKERIGDLKPGVQNLGVSLTRSMEEYIKDRSTRAFYEQWIKPHEKTLEELRPELENEVARLERRGKMPRNLSEAGKLDYVLRRNFVQGGHENLYGRGQAELTGRNTTLAGDAVDESGMPVEAPKYLPRSTANILDELDKSLSNHMLMRASRKGTQVYKTSVMAFSLKHMMHILLGGAMFLAGRGGIDEIFKLPEAIRMVKEGRLPNEVSPHLDINTPTENFAVYKGSKLGRLYMSGPGKLAEKIARFDEFVTNVQRADALLAGEARALRKGMTPAAAREAGLQHAYKALVDIDGMNPWERNVVRQVFPFYAFMRHTLKYILTYPIDHPLRASILSRISDIEGKDFGSGLPQQLQTLFYIGEPDAEGNQTGVEMKQFNPFRDTGSYFTLAGFMQSLNPALSIPFSAMGIDKFTGSTGLYPDVEVDPKTGNLIAKRPPNAPWNAVTTIVPELDAIDHFFGLTKDMRDLKARNPEAYKNRLWATLFLPFQPKRANKGEEAAGMQRNELAVMQQEVARATRTGDTSALDKYPLIPYQGQLIPPQILEAFLKAAKKKRPNVSPKAALPQVKLVK